MKRKTVNNTQIDLELPKNLIFSDICKFIRKTLKVTQRMMAEKLDTDVRTYQKWEYGTSLPSDFSAFNLAILYQYALSKNYALAETEKLIEKETT